MTASTVTGRTKIGESDEAGEAAGPLRLPGGRDGRDPERAIKRGPSRVPRELVLATQRDRLYDGLVRTVAEHGYGNATVTDICRAAGVTRPAFYEHFDGKEGAFLAAYTHGTDLLLEVLDQAYAAHTEGWRSAVWQTLEILLDVLAGAPAFAAMAIVEIEAAGPAARRRRVDLLHRFRRFFAEAPEPPGAVDRAELTDTVIGGVYSAIYQRISTRGAGALPQLKPVLAYFVTAPFGLVDPRPPQPGPGPRPKVVLPCLPLFLAADQHSESDVNSGD